MKTIIQRLIKYLRENKEENSEKIANIELLILDSFDESIKEEDFYKIPTQNFLKIIEKSEFDDPNVIPTIVKRFSEFNPSDAPLILNVISSPFSTLKECVNIISSLGCSSICKRLKELYDIEMTLTTRDYETEIQEMNEKIEKMSKKLKRGVFGIMDTIEDMEKDMTLSNFNELISQLNDNKDKIPEIEENFPYKEFEGTKFDKIFYWMKMFTKLHEANVSFNVIVEGQEHEFKYDAEPYFKPTYIFNEKDELILSRNTRFVFPKRAGVKSIPNYGIPTTVEQEKLSERSPLFYNLTNYFISNKTGITRSLIKQKLSKSAHWPEKSST